MRLRAGLACLGCPLGMARRGLLALLAARESMSELSAAVARARAGDRQEGVV